MKKFEFTGETKTIQLDFETVTLHRIRAIKNFGRAKAGDLGGWIEKEENLSHEGNAWVYGDAKVWDNAVVYGNAKVWGSAYVWGNAKVWGNAEVYENAVVCDNAVVYGNAKVWGSAYVWGSAKVSDYAEVFYPNHVMTIGAIGSRNDFTTFYRGKDKKILVKCGCFNGTIDEFVDKVTQTHGNSKHALVYQKAAELAKIQIDLSCEPQESEDNE